MSAPKSPVIIPRNLNLTLNAIRQISFLALVYIVLIFVLPASKETMRQYNLSNLDYKIIDFATAIPSIIVWFAGFASFATIREYSRAIKDTSEGEHYEKMAYGLAWLAWSLPITAIISLILSSISYKASGFHSTSIIASNYINLLLPLVAFSIIGAASRGIASTTRLKFNLVFARTIALVFLVVSVFYCFLTFSHLNLHRIGSTGNPYYLPVWLMIISVVIPYLYVWFIGLTSAYEITLYSRQTKGLLYRSGLNYLAGGLVIIITSSIALQYLNGVEPRVGHLVLNPKLVASVIFHLISGVGYVIMAYGAIKLKKIEEV